MAVRASTTAVEAGRTSWSRRRAGLVLALVGLASTGVALDSRDVQAVPPSIHFTAAGDYASTTATGTVLDGIKAAGPEFNLALGDLSYGPNTGEEAWCDYVKARVGHGFPFELISGNHESTGTQNGDINDFAACLPNQLPGVVGTYGRQWHVDYPKQNPTARFILISPGLTFPEGTWSYAAGTPRYQWTAAAIDGARAAGIPWVVVGVHKPCISLGAYGCESHKDVYDLLVSKKVDLVLNGHEHHYQRSKQIAFNAACPSLVVGAYEPACVADGDDALVKGAGTVMATVGTGGVELRNVSTADAEVGYFRSWSALNVNPTHGFLDVQADAETLTGRFVGTNGSYTDSFTISPGATPPPNTAPTASIAAPTCDGLRCTFDGSSSSDAEGPIASYAWAFGDGSVATGATAAHDFASAGSYSVTLTVTDSAGLSGSAVRQVTVSSAPAPGTLVSDSFSRTVTGSLGTADTGGAWSVTGSTSNVSVSGGAGKLVMRTAGGGQVATLPSATRSTDADVAVTLNPDKAGSGATWYVTVIGRYVPGGGDYGAKLRVLSNGSLAVSLDRAGPTGAETTIASATAVTGLTYTAGTPLRVRLQVTGTAPTQLRVKVWPAGSPEPTAWTRSATDSTSAVQAAGYYGIRTYLSSGATAAPVTLSVDDLLVTPAGP